MASGPIVIVGANLAGGRASEELRKKGFDGAITLIGEEPERPYERPPLSKEFLRGEQPLEKAFLRPETWYPENDVTLRLGERAERLDLDARAVELRGGERVPFDKLLLVTGGRPRMLSNPGADLPGISTFRTYRDAQALSEQLKPGARVVVVGAGFIGSEIAAAARTRGADVTLFEAEAVPLVRALGEQLGRIYGQIHRDNGVVERVGLRLVQRHVDARTRGRLRDARAHEARADDAQPLDAHDWAASLSRSRSSMRRILPVSVLGRSLTNSILRGYA